MSLYRQLCHCAACLILLIPMTASAGIIVLIDNVSLTTGGRSGFVDVNVSWQDPDPGGPGSISSVNIDQFFANLVITPIGSPTSVVSFRAIFDPVAMVTHNGDHQYADINYLFAGNSLNMSQMPIAHAGTVSGINDTVFNGSDARFDFNPLNEPGNLITLTAAPKLLYRMELQATGTAIGTEQFQLAIDPSPSSQFLDNGGAEIAFSSVFGTIAVTQGSAAVPEPSTSFALILATGCYAWRVRKRRRS